MDIHLTRDEATGVVTVKEHTSDVNHEGVLGSIDIVDIKASLDNNEITAYAPIINQLLAGAQAQPVHVTYAGFGPAGHGPAKTLRESLHLSDQGYLNTQTYVVGSYFMEDYAGTTYVF